MILDSVGVLDKDRTNGVEKDEKENECTILVYRKNEKEFVRLQQGRGTGNSKTL